MAAKASKKAKGETEAAASEATEALTEASETSVPVVQLFTDGACSGNPGPGGWAFILRHKASGREKRMHGGRRLTTNNQMELSAVIVGLETLKRRSRVEVITDSQYVCLGMTQWVKGWIKNGWRRGKKGPPVKNTDLWQRLVELNDKHEVTYVHVRGHAGHAENEACDEMAVDAAQQAALSGDFEGVEVK